MLPAVTSMNSACRIIVLSSFIGGSLHQWSFSFDAPDLHRNADCGSGDEGH